MPDLEARLVKIEQDIGKLMIAVKSLQQPQAMELPDVLMNLLERVAELERGRVYSNA